MLTYACDTADELQRAMQQDADILHDWLCRNVLTMNTVKTKYMMFGAAKNVSNLHIVFGGALIDRVRQYKYLGLILDEQLSFNLHVNHVKKQIRPFISLMWRNSKFIPLDQRKKIYFAYVQSHLVYMLAIYGECGAVKLKELQTIQNQCIKSLYRLPRLTSSTFLYSSTLLPVTEMARVERVVLMHRMKLSLTKHNFCLVNNVDVHGRSTRRNNEIHVFNPFSTRTSTNAAIMRASDEYNSLPNCLKGLTNLDSFKVKVKLLVMNQSENYSAISPFFYIN